MSDEYGGAYTGAEIDEAISMIRNGTFPTFVLKINFGSAFAGQTYTVTSEEGESYQGIVPDSLRKLVPVLYGGTQYTVTSTNKDNGREYSENVLTGSAFGQYAVTLRAIGYIFGVTWDGTSTSKWARIDDGSGFSDPVPYVAGATTYGSPFDDIMPWAGMTIEERTGGTMVKIPKFWYQLYQNTEGTPSSGMTIRISNKPIEGFSVSPAHMDRGDGHGERDVIYVGRYHCASDYKSKTKTVPAMSKKEVFRTNIHALGSTIWQWDFATLFTIWLLYLVEFADWNSQERIGYGCSTSTTSSLVSVGYTDSMPYHTGTMLSNRTVFGASTQYRGIEGLWDNYNDLLDGCYFSNEGLNIILNPSNFSNTSNGVLVGPPATNGLPTSFVVKDIKNTFKMFISYTSIKDELDYSKYCCDIQGFGGNNGGNWPIIFVGGGLNNTGVLSGLFSIDSTQITDASRLSRVLELP